MGYFGKLKEKGLAIQLREKGWSYNKIRTKVHVSKDTISRWCRDIILTEGQKLKLQSLKEFGQKKGSLIAAQNKKERRVKETKIIYGKSKHFLGNISDRDRFIAGLSLYAGEGTKHDGAIAFANSDPLLIRFMSEWLKKYCDFEKERIRGSLWIHEGLDISRAQKYWSDISKIPLSQFYAPYIVKNKQNGIRKNLHSFGVFSIRLSDSRIHRQIMGWISALFNDKIPFEL